MSTEKSNGWLDGISHGTTHKHAAEMCQQSRVRLQGRPVREPINPSPEHFSVESLHHWPSVSLCPAPSCLIFAIILYHPTDLCYFLSSSSACFLFPFLSLAFFCLSFIFSSLGTRRHTTHRTPFLHNKSTHCHTPDINPRPQSQ